MKINHGANLHEISKLNNVDLKDIKDFSSNINPFGVSKKVSNFLKQNASELITYYPDPEYIELKKSIANYNNCHFENIILGNGATELISSYIKHVSPKNAVLVIPSYSEFEKELKLNNTNIKYFKCNEQNDFKININDLINEIKTSKSKLLILCNPLNPTGFALTNNEIEKIQLESNVQILVDETYIEFTDMNNFSCKNLAEKNKNIFVIRGTSKFFSTPGLRLGYAILSDENTKKTIQKKQKLWNINTIAAKVGELMFNDKNHIAENKNFIKEQSLYLQNELKKINTIKVFETKSNFILCKINKLDLTASQLRNKLISKNLIIRDCSSFEGLNEQYFRICILDEKSNKNLIKNLKIELL